MTTYVHCSTICDRKIPPLTPFHHWIAASSDCPFPKDPPPIPTIPYFYGAISPRSGHIPATLAWINGHADDWSKMSKYLYSRVRKVGCPECNAAVLVS